MEDKTMILLFGAVVMVMLCILFLRKRKTAKKHEETDYDAEFYDDSAVVGSENAESDDAADDEAPDFEEAFFARCQQGEEEQHFLNLASQQDAAILQSLLYSADIPSRIDSDIMNKIYGGTASAATGIFCIRLYILQNDYDAALAIVRDYAREKTQALGERDSAAKEAALEALAFLATPSPLSKSQQIFGITVFPKEKQR